MLPSPKLMSIQYIIFRYSWAVTFESPGGTYPLMEISSMNLHSEPEVPTIESSRLERGGLKFEPIPGAFVRPAFENPQVRTFHYRNTFHCNCNCILFTKLPWPGDSEVCDLRVKLPPTHLSITHSGNFTLSFLMLNVKQGSREYIKFYSLWFDPTGNRPRPYVLIAIALSTLPALSIDFVCSPCLTTFLNW